MNRIEIATDSMDAAFVLEHGFHICPLCKVALVAGSKLCAECEHRERLYNDMMRLDGGIDQNYELRRMVNVAVMRFLAALIAFAAFSMGVGLAWLNWRSPWAN